MCRRPSLSPGCRNNLRCHRKVRAKEEQEKDDEEEDERIFNSLMMINLDQAEALDGIRTLFRTKSFQGIFTENLLWFLNV